MLADSATAEQAFEIAITSSAAGWPFYTARALLAYGEWLRRQRRNADSRTPLREAARIFDALGLRRFGERARSELRASGERARSRVPEAWTELSPQELQSRSWRLRVYRTARSVNGSTCLTGRWALTCTGSFRSSASRRARKFVTPSRRCTSRNPQPSFDVHERADAGLGSLPE